MALNGLQNKVLVKLTERISRGAEVGVQDLDTLYAGSHWCRGTIINAGV